MQETDISTKKLWRCFFVLFFLLLIISATGQITQRNILPDFSDQQLAGFLIPQNDFKPFPKTADGWHKVLPDSLIRFLIEKGDESLSRPFGEIPATIMLEFTRNNNRTDYESISFSKRSELWNMVLAEAVSGNGKYTDQIVNGIWSICEESFWGISAHVGIQKAGPGLPDVEDPVVDLFAAETAALLAWTDYFIGPRLDTVSKLIRKRIRYEIDRRVFTPMTTAQYGWMGGGNPNAKTNNWAPWIASNYITANLLIQKDQAKKIEALNIAIKIINHYMNGLGDDGGCDEGPSYWTAAGACVFDALNLLYDATGGHFDVYKNRFIDKMGAYIYNTHIDGKYFINVADAHPTMEPDGLLIFRFGKAAGNQNMMNMGSWAFHTYGNSSGRFHHTRTLYNLPAIKECAAYPYKENPVNDVWYSDVQLMASRTGNNLFVASHAGNNGESHNHNDVGDFVVYSDGSPVIIDVGSGTYTARTFSKDRYKLWFNTSPFHNLPTVNNTEQREGGRYAAGDVAYQKTKSSSQLSMDIANAYPSEAGIESWNRNVELDKSTNNVWVKDRFELKNATNNISQTFMTVCETDITSPGKIIFYLPGDQKVFLDYDAKIWEASKEKIALATPEDQGLKESWQGRDIWRILLQLKKPVRKGSILYKIYK
jgi:hypothetical protein